MPADFLSDLFESLVGLLRASRPVVQQTIVDAILGAWVGGASSVVVKLPVASTSPLQHPSTPPPPIPPDTGTLLYPDPDDEPLVRLPAIDQAVKQLADRQILDADDFRELSASAKGQAFTISGDLTEKSLEKIRDVLVENVEAGASLEGFSEAVEEAFETLPISRAHLEQVYRNNVNESFSQGAETILAHPLVDDAFPFRLYVPIHDARARPEHRALEAMGLNGTAVYHKEDPTWLTFRPPWSWGCRCGWVAIGIEEAARRGVREAQEWLETGVEPPHVWVPAPPFSPPVGWDRGVLVA